MGVWVSIGDSVFMVGFDFKYVIVYDVGCWVC